MSQSTGCDSAALFEEIYAYYARPAAWQVTPGAETALQQLKDAGLRVSCTAQPAAYSASQCSWQHWQETACSDGGDTHAQNMCTGLC